MEQEVDVLDRMEREVKANFLREALMLQAPMAAWVVIPKNDGNYFIRMDVLVGHRQLSTWMNIDDYIENCSVKTAEKIREIMIPNIGRAVLSPPDNEVEWEIR